MGRVPTSPCFCDGKCQSEGCSTSTIEECQDLFDNMKDIVLKISRKEFDWRDKGKTNYVKGIGDMSIALGHIEVVENNMFQALDYYLKASEAFINSNTKSRLAVAYLLLGNVFHALGNYPNALSRDDVHRNT